MKPEGKPEYGICFEWGKHSDLVGSVVIKSRDISALCPESADGLNLQEMFGNLSLSMYDPYDRFVLREAMHALVSKEKSSRQTVQPRASRAVCVHVLEQLLSMRHVIVRYGRPAGLKISFTEDSWLLDALHDLGRFDQDWAEVAGNIDGPRPSKIWSTTITSEELAEHSMIIGTNGSFKTKLHKLLGRKS
jgi:hypothetical protein